MSENKTPAAGEPDNEPTGLVQFGNMMRDILKPERGENIIDASRRLTREVEALRREKKEITDASHAFLQEIYIALDCPKGSDVLKHIEALRRELEKSDNERFPQFVRGYREIFDLANEAYNKIEAERDAALARLRTIEAEAMKELEAVMPIGIVCHNHPCHHWIPFENYQDLAQRLAVANAQLVDMTRRAETAEINEIAWRDSSEEAEKQLEGKKHHLVCVQRKCEELKRHIQQHVDGKTKKDKKFQELFAKLEAAEAQNARLREALEHFAFTPSGCRYCSGTIEYIDHGPSSIKHKPDCILADPAPDAASHEQGDFGMDAVPLNLNQLKMDTISKLNRENDDLRAQRDAALKIRPRANPEYPYYSAGPVIRDEVEQTNKYWQVEIKKALAQCEKEKKE